LFILTKISRNAIFLEQNQGASSIMKRVEMLLLLIAFIGQTADGPVELIPFKLTPPLPDYAHAFSPGNNLNHIKGVVAFSCGSYFVGMANKEGLMMVVGVFEKGKTAEVPTNIPY